MKETSLQANKTNKERSILDEAFVLVARQSGNQRAAVIFMRRVLMLLGLYGKFAGFGKN